MSTNLTRCIAAAVRAAMRARGVRQVDVALALGLSQPAVSARLNGRTPFTLADLERLADLLGVTVSELLQPPAEPIGESA